MTGKGYTADRYRWPEVKDEEKERLAKRLAAHCIEMGVPKGKRMNPAERLQFVKDLLAEQRGTCAFSDGDSRYCWNEPRDEDLEYLKLQWGHIVPKEQWKKTDKTMENLYLICARCNNNIQKSRTLNQLVPELAHKLRAIRKLYKRL